jgi:uncharacterized membrane protein YkvI
LKSSISKVFQISAVFIGTIVGAGLASGREITQFFTSYGYKSFIGIAICGLMYILVCSMISKISLRYNLKSYNELITLVSPGFLGKVTDIITSMFLISGAAIILAGSGDLIKQYFGVSKWVGIILMLSITLLILMRDTQGLIEVNTIIVPSLIIVLSTVFILYILFSKDNININFFKSIPYLKKPWLISTFLYAGFNIICCSGVLVPLSAEIKSPKVITWGIIFGSIGLTLLCIMINMMLMLNVPYIYKYPIPLLYVANRFGDLIQIMLLIIIWLEMFSTEVSDIYSVGKTLSSIFKISYKKSVFIILAIAIPISQFGFINLIKILYPSFGVISVIFIVQCAVFYSREFSTFSRGINTLYNLVRKK